MSFKSFFKTNLNSPRFLRWSVFILAPLAVILALNVDINGVFGGRIQNAIYGEGEPHFLMKWVQPTPPDPVVLSSGGSVTCRAITLAWTDLANADYYKIYRSTAGGAFNEITPYNPFVNPGHVDVNLTENTDYAYRVDAYNAVGSSRSNTLSIKTPYCPPIISFDADPSAVYPGGRSLLTWSTSKVFATNPCVASEGWSGAKADRGNEVVIPNQPPYVIYTLTCSGPGGAAKASVTVTIVSSGVIEVKPK